MESGLLVSWRHEGVSWIIQCHHGVLLKGKEKAEEEVRCQQRQGQREAGLLALQMEAGPRARGRGRPPEAGGGQERSSPRSPQRSPPCPPPDLSPGRPASASGNTQLRNDRFVLSRPAGELQGSDRGVHSVSHQGEGGGGGQGLRPPAAPPQPVWGAKPQAPLPAHTPALARCDLGTGG